MTRIKPAVVDSPDNGFPGFCKVSAKFRIVEEITVDVVDVDDIRIDFLNAPDEPPGGPAGDQPVGVEQAGGQPVEKKVKTVPHRNKGG